MSAETPASLADMEEELRKAKAEAAFYEETYRKTLRFIIRACDAGWWPAIRETAERTLAATERTTPTPEPTR